MNQDYLLDNHINLNHQNNRNILNNLNTHPKTYNYFYNKIPVYCLKTPNFVVYYHLKRHR